MTCPNCKHPSFENKSGDRICVACRSGRHSVSVCAVLRRERADRHMMEALKIMAKWKCDRSRCGTVCLCGPCHARKALEFYDPEWRP